jgi:hypothetical protein
MRASPTWKRIAVTLALLAGCADEVVPGEAIPGEAVPEINRPDGAVVAGSCGSPGH